MRNLFILILFVGFSLAAEEFQIQLLFTHDLHSNFIPFKTINSQGLLETHGGYARLSTLIKELKPKNSNAISLVLDAGDFSMGTIFNTLYTMQPSELMAMAIMGYDVVTLGNHEFDFGLDNLASMLKMTSIFSYKMPAIISSNTNFEESDPAVRNLKKVFEELEIPTYIILKKNNLKIAFIGLLGKDAASDAPFAKPLKFDPIVKSAKLLIKELKQNKGVDIIIALSHSGTLESKLFSEDAKLAKKIPEIDIIISGHTHRLLEKPIIIGKTIIASCGQYGENLGEINLSYSKEQKVKLLNYKIHPVNDTIENDLALTAFIQNLKDRINKDYLQSYNLKFDQTVIESPTTLPHRDLNQNELALGDLITDSFRASIKALEGSNYEHISVAIEPLGTIRSPLFKGISTVSDIFKILPLGIGVDNSAGNGLVSVYLTGKELRQIFEFDATIAPFKRSGALQLSGAKFSYNPYRMLLDKVTDAEVENFKGELEPIDNTKLYRVVLNYYTANMIEYAQNLSFGLLTFIPKNKKGEPIRQISDAILKNNSKDLKEWIALTNYLKSFPDINNNKIPDLPQIYFQNQNRKISEPSLNPLDILKNAHWPTYLAIVIFCFIISMFSLSLYLIIRLFSSRRRLKSL